MLYKVTLQVANKEFDDFINPERKRRSNLPPAVVVDDGLMKVTHIIRGDESSDERRASRDALQRAWLCRLP